MTPSIFPAAVHQAFEREFILPGAPRPSIVAATVPTSPALPPRVPPPAVPSSHDMAATESEAKAHNRARSLAIMANSKVRNDFLAERGYWPTPMEETAMFESGVLSRIPKAKRFVASAAEPAPALVVEVVEAVTVDRSAEVKEHNRLRSLAILENGAARDEFRRIHGRHPSEQDEENMVRSGKMVAIPPIQRFTMDKPVTETIVGQAKGLHLRKRTQEEWCQMIYAIEDENLRMAVAKKVYWDYFARRKWRGLDSLVHEDAECRFVRFFTPETAPAVSDIRISLWQLGYPVAIIRAQYDSKFVFRFSVVTSQDD